MGTQPLDPPQPHCQAGRAPTCLGAAGLQRTLSRGHFSTHECPLAKGCICLAPLQNLQGHLCDELGGSRGPPTRSLQEWDSPSQLPASSHLFSADLLPLYLLMGGEASPRSKGRRSQCVQGLLLDSGASPSTSLPPPAGAPCLAGGH